MRKKPANSGHKVAIVVYGGLCAFEFGIAVEVFALPRPELDVPWYECRVCSIEEGPLRASGDISFEAPFGPDTLEWADTIVIPGWCCTNKDVPGSIVEGVTKAHKRGTRLVSICSGAFVLAAAGVLDGLRAVTHWRYVDQLQAAFPAIDVIPDTLYVDEGQILTSAGSAAGLDLCLHIVRQDFGSVAANSVAKRLLLPTHRDGGQRQFIPSPVSGTGRRINPLLEWLRAHIDTPHTVASMAGYAGQSERTFLRHFHQATGTTPQAWLTVERVKRAKDLLEATDLNVAQIAEHCGFATAETFRHHFRRAVGVPPTRYRISFQPG